MQVCFKTVTKKSMSSDQGGRPAHPEMSALSLILLYKASEKFL
jgi:hypothetical protein